MTFWKPRAIWKARMKRETKQISHCGNWRLLNTLCAGKARGEKVFRGGILNALPWLPNISVRVLIFTVVAWILCFLTMKAKSHKAPFAIILLQQNTGCITI